MARESFCAISMRVFARAPNDARSLKYVFVVIGSGLVVNSWINSTGSAAKPTPAKIVKKNQPKKAMNAMMYRGKLTGITQSKKLTAHN